MSAPAWRGQFAEALREALGLPGYDRDPGDPGTVPARGAAAAGTGGSIPMRSVTGGGDRGARELPAGEVTLVFTDIEGSTALLSRLGEAYGEALLAQRTIMRTAIAGSRGLELSTEGDSFFVVFESAADAVRCCVAAQRALAAHDWPQDATVRVRMGVHPFTLDGAAAVAGAGAEPAVLHLVDCSLICPPGPGPDGRPRYLMLETLRAFGAARLAEAGEQEAAGARLAGYALQVAEQAADAMQTSAGELAAARWLDAEDATTQQALAWALEHQPGGALRLATALAPWWVLRGTATSGYPLLSAAAERAGPDGGSWPAAQYWLGYTANLAGDFLGALKHYALAINAVADDPRSPILADATAGRASCLTSLRRTAESAEEASQALGLARQIGYPAGEARALWSLSTTAQHDGDEQKALEWARQATHIDPQAIPGRLARQISHSLADILVDMGDLAAAEDSCVTELDRARQAGDLGSQSFCLDMLAELDQRAGRIPEAGAHLREALEIATRIGSQLRLIDGLNNCGHLCAATQRWADAVTMWAAHIASLKEIGMTDLPAAAERRQEPLRAAGRALGPGQTRAAERRGADMTLATAAELAILLAGTDSAAQVPVELPGLSARERDLVVLVAQGRTNAEIAGQLHLSVSAVRRRLDRVRDKAGCPRRADLVRLALQAGLV